MSTFPVDPPRLAAGAAIASLALGFALSAPPEDLAVAGSGPVLRPAISTQQVAASAAPLAVLGPSLGWIEPCGCSGGQLGGIHRVGAAFAVGAPGAVGRVAAGGAVSTESLEYPAWAQAQLDSVWNALGPLGLGLDAVGLASTELSLGLTTLAFSSVFLDGGTQLVSTNLVLPADAPLGVAASWSSADGAWTLLSFLPEGTAGGEAPLAWHASSVEEAVERLRASGGLPVSSRPVALVEGDAQRAAEVAAVLGGEAVVLWHGAYGDADPELHALGKEGAEGAFLGGRLRHVVSLAARDGVLRYGARGVSEDLPTDPLVNSTRELYREFLGMAQPNVVEQVADSRGVHPGGKFAGSESCQACHADEYEIWTETLHHAGMETLADDLRGAQPATVDPRCVNCHSVGFGFRTGYASADVPPEQRRALVGGLAGIGCESCHGPGARHNATEASADIESARRTPGQPPLCLKCHDSDNDPHFDFEEYWERIRH